MIDVNSKFFSLDGDMPLGGPSTWHVIDWDQRRIISVTMDGEQDDENIAIGHLSRLSSQISPGIYRVHISDAGKIIALYTDLKDDPTYCIHYPFLHQVTLLESVQTIRRDRLEELDRLGPGTDLVAYPPCKGAYATKSVFKYYFMWQYAQRCWKEMNLWMRLPRHPNIVPFDRVVVDELECRIVGFTSIYIPGGSLEENKTRVFKLGWLQQLINVVDDLNLRYGIAHQDIAPRNLVIDEPTDSIMLFDFNFAARIDHPALPGEGEGYRYDRNDVKGVIFTAYEIITRDDRVRSMPHEEQNTADLAFEWVVHPEVKLDHPVASYQIVLSKWQQQRGSRYAIPMGGVQEAIHWPSRPRPPQGIMHVLDANMQPSQVSIERWFEMRQDVRNRGGKVLNWERPPQMQLDSGTRLLSTGESIKCMD